ncbi:unnamed protein product [Gongylonema pulchrum]|uniref:Uncharacterized protein n=1 Tax=Gongylonema pulchrum TaxID=637853 RepID=A0A183D4C7_9BILA|nr:unnamed protein product [Gongylonema pulchrum]
MHLLAPLFGMNISSSVVGAGLVVFAGLIVISVTVVVSVTVGSSKYSAPELRSSNSVKAKDRMCGKNFSPFALQRLPLQQQS